MEPIGPLMWEHRNIERAIKLVEKGLEKIRETGKIDQKFLHMVTDFFHIYADRTHHGKEEDILFKTLRAKSLSREHERIMDELIRDHVKGRELIGKLKNKEKVDDEDSAKDLERVVSTLESLLQLYPQHIEKEDKHFFFPILEYFSKQEREDMLLKFYEFDRQLMHEKYKKILDNWEAYLCSK